jgi:hypothetical protein
MLAVYHEQRAKGRRLKDKPIEPTDPDAGNTYYLGSPSSPVRARLYEKGKERYGETGDPFWLDYFDVVRLELQVRPEKAFKGIAATMGTEAFWGCTDWSRQVAQGVLAMSAEPIQMKAPQRTDHEGRMRSCITQYGPTLRDHRNRFPSLEAFALDLARRLGVDADEESPQAAEPELATRGLAGARQCQNRRRHLRQIRRKAEQTGPSRCASP